MKEPRVRYGPSPTGIPHIGNIRTALFNYLFAKSQNGKFYLRIEDTDQARIIPGAVEKIKESLESLSINWDGDVVVQSKRLSIYEKYLEVLKSKKLVDEEKGAWRFKIDHQNQHEEWEDAVHGKVSFPTNVLEDFIIIKSDGFPTYHFASVVDDHEMEITHVMRGDEWISSTPKHIQIYKAFGWQHPEFVHLPPILGSNHKKLSKREGAKSVLEYINEGYLPEAIVNFLALLGWSPKGNQEIFSLKELCREFSLDRINKNSPIFNIDKLNWFNQEWIKSLSPEEFKKKIESQFPHKNTYKSTVTASIAPLVGSRITTLNEFPKIADPFYQKPVLSQEVMSAVPLSGASINQYAEKLGTISNLNPENLRAGTTAFAEENKLETKDLYRSLGVAEFGSLVTPPLPESVNIIGKEETIERLNDLAKKQK